jgi:hypothetical protein
LVLLILSDFDPDGEEIAASFARSMRDDFGIYEVVPHKAALTFDQVDRFNLQPNMMAKRGSSNYRKFAEQYGDDVFELESIDPENLQILVRDAIESVVDRDALNKELDAERADAAELAARRRAVLELLHQEGSEE